LNGDFYSQLHTFRKGEGLCLEMSGSLAWMHWGTLALFFIAYTGAPIFWDRMSLYFIIMPLAICGFIISWYRVGKKRTRVEIIAVMILGLALVFLSIAFGLSSSWPLALLGADVIASVCAAYSFTLKKTRDYLYIIAASGALLVICAMSRSTLSLIPIMVYLALLIPVVHLGLKEHLRRTREGHNLSVEAQGKSRAPYSSYIIPALILLLITAALFFLLPKPLHRPPEEKREDRVQGQGQYPKDLQEELESPQGQGGTSWSPTAGDAGEGAAPGEEGSPSDTDEAPSPDDSAGEPGGMEEGGQPQEGAPSEGEDGTEEDGQPQEGAPSEGEGGLSPALLFELESAMARLVKIKAFDRYSNGEWSYSTQATEYISDSPLIELNQVLSEISGEYLGNFSRADLVFHLNQDFGRDMPVGLNPVAVRLPEHEVGGSYGVYEDVISNLYSREDMPSGYSYAVTSFIPEKIVLSDGSIPQEIKERYAVSYTACPGLAEMAAEATAGSETQQEKTFSIMDYMEENFSYDPSISLSDGDQSLNIYINQQRSGDVLLAATAMILLCREVGIPARLVTGFVPRTFNSETGRFEVYSSDVSMWVDIYFPHSGWLPYDPAPTPKDTMVEGPGFESGEGTPLNTETGEPSRQGDISEDVEIVEGGTSERQIERSMKDLGESSESETSTPGSNIDIPSFILYSIAAILVLALLLFVGWKLYSWYKKRRGKGKIYKKESIRKRAMDRDSGLYVHLTYKKMCEELAAAGLKKEKSETPDEFMDRIESYLPTIVGYAEPITSALKDVIYGMKEVSSEYLHYLEVCLQYLTTKCRAIPADE
jgi:transglutaminase-like putative cysteine protease